MRYPVILADHKMSNEKFEIGPRRLEKEKIKHQVIGTLLFDC